MWTEAKQRGLSAPDTAPKFTPLTGEPAQTPLPRVVQLLPVRLLTPRKGDEMVVSGSRVVHGKRAAWSGASMGQA